MKRALALFRGFAVWHSELIQRDLLIEIRHDAVLAMHPRKLHRRARSSNRVREFPVFGIRGCEGAQHKSVRASGQSIDLFRELKSFRTISQ